jgi:hypothetical protein
MFKKKFRVAAVTTLALLPILFLSGCRTGPLPQVNLSEPSWKVFQGQAVWRAKRDLPEIAGEILFAQKSDRQSFVQFTKTPFPIALAQSTTNAWRLEFPTENKSYRYPGKPPSRVIWFELARAMSGEGLKQPWIWSGSAENWRLENKSTGETLEGYFSK